MFSEGIHKPSEEEIRRAKELVRHNFVTSHIEDDKRLAEVRVLRAGRALREREERIRRNEYKRETSLQKQFQTKEEKAEAEKREKESEAQAKSAISTPEVAVSDEELSFASDEQYLLQESLRVHRERLKILKHIESLEQEDLASKKKRDALATSALSKYEDKVRAEIGDEAEISERLASKWIELKSFFSQKGEKERGVELERDLTRLNLEEELRALEHSEEGFYTMKYQKIREYREALAKGEFIEPPSIKKKVRELRDSMAIGEPVFLEGDLGSGKTEAALYVARKYFGDKEPYIVSMRKDIELGDLVGRTQIKGRAKLEEEAKKVLQEESVKRALARFEAIKKERGEGFAEGEEELVKDMIVRQEDRDYEEQIRSQVETEFVRGQMFLAMEEGRPFIIDEINAAPHELTIALNHYLTRRAGDTVRVQQNGGREILIKEGFCFVFTGNVGSQYAKDRQNMDPAFLSRLHRIKWDYPPQATNVSYPTFLESETERNQKPFEEADGEESVPAELFQMLVAFILDDSGNFPCSKESLDELFRLATVSRLCQENFSGKEIDASVYQNAGATVYRLKKSVPSLRNLIAVIKKWKEDNFVRPLDYFLYRDFIAQAENGKDRAFLIALFGKQGGFFMSPHFKERGSIVTATADGADLNSEFTLDVSSFENERSLKTLTAQRLQRGVSESLSPREIVDGVFGSGPVPTKYGTFPLDANREKGGSEKNEGEVLEIDLMKEREVIDALLEGSLTQEKYRKILDKVNSILATRCTV